ncbi:MAG: ribonuclease III [Anaerolineales bacterium]|nr:ribonuclease III [Anaerolineales bacterium]MCX7609582.1 ribonuclease III [Anaerolineales bacterium]
MRSSFYGEASESPAAFAERLKLPFRDRLLLTRALTHRSYLNEHPEALEDNERLEFLGDAVLDFLSGAWLYNRFPEMDEGSLTRMRSALVRTEQLASFARQIRIGQALRMGRGEAAAGGRERDITLCAAFEALVGALYLQGGVEVVASFVYPFFEQAAPALLEDLASFDPKSRLQEWSQAHHLGLPEYRVVHVSGPEHQPTFEVEVYLNGRCYGRGQGPSKQAAARAAAQEALTSLVGNAG